MSNTHDKARRGTNMTDASGQTEWVYNGLGQLDLYRQHAVNRLIDYNYDSTGYRTEMRVRLIGEASGASGEWVTTYGWDSAGRLDDIQDDRMSATEAYDYQWVPGTNLVDKIVTPGDLVQEKDYDELGRLESIWAENATGTELYRRTYTYDAGGQRDTLTYDTTGPTETFVYDEKRQIDTATHSTDTSRNRDYDYDEIGNRESATEGATTTTYVPDELNQYDSITTGGTTENPSYDANGSLTDDGEREMDWNEENRLVVVRLPNETKRVEYLYDGSGRRVERRVYNALTGGTAVETERYLYDGWNAIAFLDGTNALTDTHTWGLDLSGSLQRAGGVGGLLGIDSSGGAKLNVFYDGNGNVVRLYDTSRTLRAEYEYDPFGNVIVENGDLAAGNRWRFSTKLSGYGNGLIYYGFRYYMPDAGSWASRDPIEETGGLNLYGFLGNRTPNYVDTLGMAPRIVFPQRFIDKVCDCAKVGAYEAANTLDIPGSFQEDPDGGHIFHQFPDDGEDFDYDRSSTLVVRAYWKSSKECDECRDGPVVLDIKLYNESDGGRMIERENLYVGNIKHSTNAGPVYKYMKLPLSRKVGVFSIEVSVSSSHQSTYDAETFCFEHVFTIQ